MDERITTFIKQPWFIPTVTGITSFAVGGGLGYILGSRKKEAKIIDGGPWEVPDNQLTIPFSETKNLVEKATEQLGKDRVKMMQDLVMREEMTDEENNELDSAMIYWPRWQLDQEADLMLTEDEDEAAADELEEAEIQNLFAASGKGWDYDAELSARNPDEPYVIHQDEYTNAESGLEQDTYTYYAGDNILADSSDTPVYGWVNLLGDLKFGHGTTDPAVVYIRNEEKQFEWEILYHPSLYATEAGGLVIEEQYNADELKHSNGLHRFRDD